MNLLKLKLFIDSFKMTDEELEKVTVVTQTGEDDISDVDNVSLSLADDGSFAFKIHTN
jgi:hypothetical protein